jgi:hypothetical protein
MAVYSYKFTIGPNTYPDNPKVERLKIEEEVFDKLIILIPPGNWGLGGFRCKYGLDQFIPRPAESWIVGSGESIEVDVKWISPEVPWYLTLEGYNIDDTYEHAFYLRIITSKIEDAFAYRYVKELVDVLKEVLGLK